MSFAPNSLSVKVENVCHKHQTLGILCEDNIVYYNNGVEISREAYTPEHPFYGWQFDSLTQQQILLIKQRINF